MRTISSFLCAAATVLCVIATWDAQVAAATRCTVDDVSAAMSEIGRQEDWAGVYQSFKRYRHCDEGVVAEEYSDAIGHLLAHNWEQVAGLVNLVGSDREFGEFVVRHIDENIGEADAQLIVSNARSRCPSKARWLCKAIADY